MAIRKTDEDRFLKACYEIINVTREKNGIGTLGEKTVHAVLKHYFEPDTACQEVKIDNFVADIFRENEIFEIQTRSFHSMRKKLDFFLEKYPVTIVYPIIHVKWLFWIDETTGEISKKRKSPKTGTPYDAYFELYKIKSYLSHPNLHLCLVMIDAEEYRLLNGWSKDRKRGSTRYDRIPTKIIDELHISNVKDYIHMIPEDLPQTFTTKDFSRQGKVSIRVAGLAVNILRELKIIEHVGKKGRAFLYRINPSVKL